MEFFIVLVVSLIVAFIVEYEILYRIFEPSIKRALVIFVFLIVVFELGYFLILK